MDSTSVITAMLTIFGIEALCGLLTLVVLAVVVFSELEHIRINRHKHKGVGHGRGYPSPKTTRSGVLHGASYDTEISEAEGRPETETERLARERVESENKAFSDLMSYSVEQAYGISSSSKTAQESASEYSGGDN